MGQNALQKRDIRSKFSGSNNLTILRQQSSTSTQFGLSGSRVGTHPLEFAHFCENTRSGQLCFLSSDLSQTTDALTAQFLFLEESRRAKRDKRSQSSQTIQNEFEARKTFSRLSKWNVFSSNSEITHQTPTKSSQNNFSEDMAQTISKTTKKPQKTKNPRHAQIGSIWFQISSYRFLLFVPTNSKVTYYDRTFKGHTKRGQTATPKQGSQFGAPGNARQQNLLKNRSVSWIWSRRACGDWEPNLLWQNDNDHACPDALSKMRHQNRKVEVDQKIISSFK